MRAIHVTGPNAADWQEITVPDSDSLETYQRAVGGYIEALPTIDSARASVYFNDSGKTDELPPTAVWVIDGLVADIIRGPLVLLGPVDDKGNTTALTDEALAYIREQVRPLRDYFPTDDDAMLLVVEQRPFAIFVGEDGRRA